jgi:hypothetical protein
VDEIEQVKPIYNKINDMLNEQKKLLKLKDEAVQKSREIKILLTQILDIVDYLFDILRKINGRVDWNGLETSVNSIEERIKILSSQIQKLPQINLDLKELSMAIKERLPDQISKETFNLLCVIHKYFEDLASNEDRFIKELELHPNFYDGRNIILAHYTLNDIILGTILEDKEVEKENQEFARILGKLAEDTKLKMETDEIGRTLNKLSVEGEKEKIIVQLKLAFRQQLKELITP